MAEYGIPYTPGSDADMPDVTLDTGSGVPGPHDPQGVSLDGGLIADVRQRLDLALRLREAHAKELAEQQAFHQYEIERCGRVIAACNAALREVDPEDQPQTATEAQMHPPGGYAQPQVPR